MANPVTIDIPGIGSVVANNAATESTLKEILKAIQGGEGGGYKKGGKPGDAKNKENAGGGGGGKDGGGKDGGGASSAALLGKTVGAIIRPVQMATGAFFALGAQTTSLINAFANAGDSFSGAAAVFSGIPVIGGMFAAVAAAADKTLGSYQSATASGATFGGSMNNFAASASAAGMTMDKFGGLIARNGEALMTLGGTTEEGAKRFSAMSKDIRNSKIGEQLYGLGYTTEQVNEGMANYIKTYGASGALQGKSTRELAQGAGQYLKELDGLAKITGQSRKALEDEQAARLKDSQFRAAIANLDADQAKMMNNFVSSFPKEQQEAVKEMIATGNITSEAGIMLNNSMPGLAQSILAQGAAVRSGVKVSQDSYDQIYKNGVREAKVAAKSSEMVSQAQFNAGQMGNAYIGMAELAKRDIDGKEKVLTEQEKAAKTQAAAMEQAKQNIAAVSNSFQMVLANSGLLNTLMSAFEAAANFTMQYLVPAFTLVTGVISALWTSLSTAFGPAMEGIGNFLVTTLYPAFQDLAAFFIVDLLPGIQTAIQNLYPVFESIAEFLLPPIKAVAGFIADNLTPILIGLGVVFGAWGAWVVASTVIGWAQTAMNIAQAAAQLPVIGGLIAMAGAVLAATWPVIALVAGVTALWLIFKKFGGDVEVVKDGLRFMWEGFKSFLSHLKLGFLKVLDYLPGVDMTDKIKETETEIEENAQRREELVTKMSERMAENRAKAEEEDIAKEKKRDEVKANLDLKKIQQSQKHGAGLESANKKEEDARNKQVALNYDDPAALLTGFAAQQNSALIQNPPSTATAGADTTRRSIVSEAETKKQEERAAAERAAAGGGSGSSGSGSTPAPSTQDSPATLLASLNTKMDQLIKISKDHHDIGAVQVSKLGQLSGDLYAGV